MSKTGRNTDWARHVGATVYKHRLAKGLSLRQLAALVGVTKQTITGIESGRYVPTLRTFIAIGRALFDGGAEELMSQIEGGAP